MNGLIDCSRNRLPLSILTGDSCRRLVGQAAADPVRFMKPLADSLQRCSYDNERASLLAGLFVPEDIRNLMDHFSGSPDFVFVLFDWCLARINFANHQGRIQESLAWNEVAAGLGALRACPQKYFCLIPCHVLCKSAIKCPVNKGATQPEHTIAI